MVTDLTTCLSCHTFFPLLSFLLSFVSYFTFLLHFSLLYLAYSLPPLSAGNSILHSAADSVTSAVQKASQALNERGERLGRAEERTADMMNSAEQFSVTAQKVSQHTTTHNLRVGLRCFNLIQRIEILISL